MNELAWSATLNVLLMSWNTTGQVTKLLSCRVGTRLDFL